MTIRYKGRLYPTTRDLIVAMLVDGCPSDEAMVAFGIETEWHFEALAYPHRFITFTTKRQEYE